MFLIIPNTIDPLAEVQTTSVPAEAPQIWSGVEEYDVGDIVASSSGKRWRALRSVAYSTGVDEETNRFYDPISILDQDPDGANKVGFLSDGTAVPGASTYQNFGEPWWEDITNNPFLENRYMMFSHESGTFTEASSIYTLIRPKKKWNGLALFGLVADNIHIKVMRYGYSSPYWETAVSGKNEPILFGGYPNKSAFAWVDMPNFNEDYYIIVNLTNDPGSTKKVKCGNFVIGCTAKIGSALLGSSVGLVDYSRKEFDTFGNLQIVKRGYSNVVNYQFQVKTGTISQVKKILASRRAKATAYIGYPDDVDDDEDRPSGIASMAVFGLINDFSIPYENIESSFADLEVHSLVRDTEVYDSKQLSVGYGPDPQYGDVEITLIGSGYDVVADCSTFFHYDPSQGWSHINQFLFIYANESLENIQVSIDGETNISPNHYSVDNFGRTVYVFSFLGVGIGSDFVDAPYFKATISATGYESVTVTIDCENSGYYGYEYGYY